jgi:hypothetical protein
MHGAGAPRAGGVQMALAGRVVGAFGQNVRWRNQKGRSMAADGTPSKTDTICLHACGKTGDCFPAAYSVANSGGFFRLSNRPLRSAY